MKTSGHLILYISENEDFELWRVLSQITPDDRAAFVKVALRKALLQGNDARSAANTWTKQSNVLRMDKSAVESPINDLALEEVGYHTLATSEEKNIKPLKYPSNEGRNNPRDLSYGDSIRNNLQEEETLDQLQFDELLPSFESQSKNALPGLNFLLTNVIGEEEDEKVIEFIRNNKTASGENT